MKLAIAVAVLISAALVVGQVHPFPGPGTASGSPLTGIVTSGLVAFWDLSTPYYVAGTKKFTDLSGTGNDICSGAYSGGACQAGAGGPVTDANYSDFTTTGMACDMPADSASLSITGDLTIEVVLYTYVVTGYPRVVHKTVVNNEYEYMLAVGKPRIDRGNGDGQSATNALTINTWYSIAVTVTGNNVAHYRNNVANGTGTTGTASDTAGVASLARMGTQYWTGRLARVRIYNRALNTTELTQNYNRDKAVLAARGISLP